MLHSLPVLGDVPAEELELVRVCHVVDPGELYVQHVGQEERLRTLQDMVNRHCTESYTPLPQQQLKQGEDSSRYGYIYF